MVGLMPESVCCAAMPVPTPIGDIVDRLRHHQQLTRSMRLARQRVRGRVLAASAVPAIVLLGLAGSAVAGSRAPASHGPLAAHRASAGGDQTVTFTVRPAILVVVDDQCRPLQLWANVGARPSAAELRTTVGRQGSASGDAVDQACVDAALLALPRGEVRWAARGQVWGAR
jgi:hypothetical protein